MAIGNLNKYVDTKKVILLGDTKEKQDEDKSVPEQLNNVFSHIEDRVEVTDRVRNSEVADLYMDPLASPMVRVK